MPRLHPFDAFISQLADAIAERISSGKKPSRRGRKPGTKMSPEAIEKIRAAAKKRWANIRKAQGAKK
jgi:hypothetical protein